MDLQDFLSRSLQAGGSGGLRQALRTVRLTERAWVVHYDLMHEIIPDEEWWATDGGEPVDPDDDPGGGEG
jgi:hypothetical protein